MPYIEDSRRDDLNPTSQDYARTPGELNYQITKLLILYLGTHQYNYTTMNEIMGALECTKQEFYRREMVPYENQKVELNGDVY